MKMLLFNCESNCSATEGTWDKSGQIPGVFSIDIVYIIYHLYHIDVEEARIEQWKSVVNHNKINLKHLEMADEDTKALYYYTVILPWYFVYLVYLVFFVGLLVLLLVYCLFLATSNV